jgi:hypothetical protein
MGLGDALKLSVSGPKSLEYEAGAVTALLAGTLERKWERNIIIISQKQGVRAWIRIGFIVGQLSIQFLEQLSDYQLVKNDSTPWC